MIFDIAESDNGYRSRDDVRWAVGEVIRVRFIGGHSTIHKEVKKYARIWMNYANVYFRFVSEEPSDVRISFFRDGGCHSKTGTLALDVQPPEPTMNLSISRHDSEEKVRRHVLHEFGHVLGCSHEHSSPHAHIPWNERAVYAHFRDLYGWDRENVFRNVLEVKSWDSIASEFDRKSIMSYEISPEITRGGFYIPWNTVLSKTDKRFIAEQYPKALALKCNRCRGTIRESSHVHFYCKNHENYLCEDCYDSSNTRWQVRNGGCLYKARNDYDREFLQCNRCRVGFRKSCDSFFYCSNHENYLCEDCHDSSRTRWLIRQGECSYEDEDGYPDDYEDDYADEYDYSY